MMIGSAVTDMTSSRREKIAAAFGSIIRNGPDANEAADIDMLAPGVSVGFANSSRQPKAAESADVDQAFREAFFETLETMVQPGVPKEERDKFRNFRDAIEQKAASILGLDINQARRALNARQFDQG